MTKFSEKFEAINNLRTQIVLEHCLFDRQTFLVDKVQVINDDERIGVVFKGKEIYLYKQDVKVYEQKVNTYVISDGRLKIAVIVNIL